MDSSADHTGSISVGPSSEGAAAPKGETQMGETLRGAEIPAGEPVKAEAVQDVAAPAETGAEGGSEPAKAEAAENASQDACKDATEPTKAEAAKESSALVEAAKTGSEVAAAKAGPGSALVALVPAAERFDTHRDATEPPHGAANSDRRKGRFILYGSQAAVVAFLLGCGYLVSSQIFHGAPAKPEAAVKPAVKTAALATPASAPSVSAAPPSSLEATERAERAELRHVTQEMADEIRGLKASLDQLRNSAAQSQSAEEIRALKKSIDGVKSGLEASKTETGASIAQLTAKLDHMQREQAAKLQQVLEKAEHAEARTSTGTLATGSLPAAAPSANATVPKPQSASAVPPAQANPADAQKKAAQSISNWVVRDVYDGIALVEGPGGAFEVMQGENIPGVGTVKSIERRGGGWVVVTTRGNVEYARD